MMVTAYDATFAQLIDEAGVDIILVGDSLGMLVQGHDSTVPVTLEAMIYHCQAVRRHTKQALVVADMPFMTACTPGEAAQHATRLMQEGQAQAIKLEGMDATRIAIVEQLTQAGIPVMGHVGLLPQHVHQLGGFRQQGKSSQEAEYILDAARKLEVAGAFALVVEAVPDALAGEITNALSIPTIGIAAGDQCKGQVLVCYDLLGLNKNLPAFVKPYANFHEQGCLAVREFCRQTRSGN